MKLFSGAAGIFDRIVNIFMVLAAIIIIIIMLAISLSVASRQFISFSWIGLIELSSMSILFVTFLGTTWVLRNEQHVTMDILVNQFSPKIRNITTIFTSTLCVIVSLVIFWYGVQVTWDRYLSGSYIFTHLTIPDAYFLFIIPLGSFLLFIQFSRRIHGQFLKFRALSKPKEESAD